MPRNPYKPLNQFDDESDKDDEDASASAFENFSLLNNNSDQSSSTTNKKKLDDSPLIELRARNANKFQQQSFNDFSPSSAENVVFIERKIRKSDSLRNLALQFGISVAELKRVNGFMSDQEFYGKDVIKIPVTKYGVHHESEESSDNVAHSSSRPGEFVDLNIDVLDDDDQPRGGGDKSSSSSQETIQFLKNVDENLLKVKTAQQQLENRVSSSPDEETDESPLDIGVVVAPQVNNKSTWLQKNVSHFTVVVLVIFVVIVVPVFIVLYKILTAVEGN